MLLKAKSSMATSIDATQRKLMVAIVMATLLALAIVIADLASGGRPDPGTLARRGDTYARWRLAFSHRR